MDLDRVRTRTEKGQDQITTNSESGEELGEKKDRTKQGQSKTNET